MKKSAIIYNPGNGKSILAAVMHYICDDASGFEAPKKGAEAQDPDQLVARIVKTESAMNEMRQYEVTVRKGRNPQFLKTPDFFLLVDSKPGMNETICALYGDLSDSNTVLFLSNALLDPFSAEASKIVSEASVIARYLSADQKADPAKEKYMKILGDAQDANAPSEVPADKAKSALQDIGEKVAKKSGSKK